MLVLVRGFLAMDGVFNRKMIREMLNNLLIGIIGLIQVILHLLTNLLQMGGSWDDLDKATVWGQDSFKTLDNLLAKRCLRGGPCSGLKEGDELDLRQTT